MARKARSERKPDTGWRKSITMPKRRGVGSSLATEFGFGGKCSSAKKLKRGFKIQDDVKMYIQLPGYSFFRCFDLPNEMELSATSQRIFTRPPTHSRLTPKHHLFNSNVPEQSRKSLIGNAMNDKVNSIEKYYFGSYLKYTFRRPPLGYWGWIL